MSFLIQNFIKMTDGIDLLFVENYCPTVWKKKMRIDSVYRPIYK